MQNGSKLQSGMSFLEVYLMKFFTKIQAPRPLHQSKTYRNTANHSQQSRLSVWGACPYLGSENLQENHSLGSVTYKLQKIQYIWGVRITANGKLDIGRLKIGSKFRKESEVLKF